MSAELKENAAGTTSPRALIVDDEPTIREALRRFFTRLGWTASEAVDGQSAFTLLTAAPAPEFDVVICDLRMPHMSGAELHDRLERENPEILSRFIFVAGDVTSPEMAEFVRRTKRPVILKPFELAALADLIKRASV
ncbi:MAG: response regulator [Gemmatimonadota bacterium]|nr:response regulator [Gemmatimonadota bacterium]